MKIVVVGGSGLIGSKVVAMLRHDGHDVLAASRRSGVDVVSGEGLTDAVQGASVVVDVTNAPSFEDAAVMKFFQDLNAQPAHGRSCSRRRTPRRVICGRLPKCTICNRARPRLPP
jgi:uncharacterized protein YbjT (DUF2867 family)